MKYTLNTVKKLFILLFFTISLLSCSKDNEILISKDLSVTELFNKKYGAEPLQNYDIYLPINRNKTTTKILILLHGGSWVSGDKEDLNPIVNSLKKSFPNYAIVNMNYQLASIGKSPFPMQLNDIEKLIKHLKSERNTYNISNKYGFIGTSAGGHLAMFYSYKYDVLNEINMVCSIVGPTNFIDENYISNPDYINVAAGIQLLTGVNFEENTMYYEDLSPLHVVKVNAPPTLLFYGGKDELIPTTQGVDLHNKLNALGVINQFTLYENEGHGWEGASLIDTYTKIDNFIITYF